MTRVKYGVKLQGQPQDLPNGVHLYTRDYFCPEKLDNAWGITENTYVIHHLLDCGEYSFDITYECDK